MDGKGLSEEVELLLPRKGDQGVVMGLRNFQEEELT